MSNIQFYGVYCDDIRHEIGNKFTLVGCYSKELYLPKLPGKLKRLCIHFSIQSEPGELPSQIKISLLNNEEPAHSIEFNVEPNENNENLSLLNGGFDIVDVHFEEPSNLSLVATIDGTAFSGPELKILATPSQETLSQGEQ